MTKMPPPFSKISNINSPGRCFQKQKVPQLSMSIQRTTVDPRFFFKPQRLFPTRNRLFPTRKLSLVSSSATTTLEKLCKNIAKFSEKGFNINNKPMQFCPYCCSSSFDPHPENNLIIRLRLCARNGALLKGCCLHGRAIKIGFEQHPQVGNSLLNLYVKCKNLDRAHQLFDEIIKRDVFTWTILIAGYTQIGLCRTALKLFSCMQLEGVFPNQYTLASTLKACAKISDLQTGKGIHGWILQRGFASDVVLDNSILDFYAKCGRVDDASSVFEKMAETDSVTWNIMLGAYLQIGDIERSIDLFQRSPFRDVATWNTIIARQIQNGFHRTALEFIYQMHKTGPSFNQITFSIALVLVSTLAMLELGKQIHCQVLRIGFSSDAFITNSLINMYCKCGKVEKALVVFDELSQSAEGLHNSANVHAESLPNTISWTSMIAGYVQNSRCEEALNLFCKMLRRGLVVNRIALTSIASACADAGILEQGKQIHAHIEKSGHGFDAFLVSTLIDMYAKCGSVEDARAIFERTKERSIVIWTSIISGHALYGQGREAVQLFEFMLEEKITPNEISFVGVLSACSHSGLVREGHEYFRLMKEDHGITPTIEHFTCMVDLFGRAGQLEEAEKFIFENRISNHGVVWRALLSACRLHNNFEMGQLVSEQLVKLEPLDAGSYVMFSNICASSQKWIEAADMRILMRERGVRKDPGRSWIQLKNKIHVFVSGDRSHPQADEIYSYLERLTGRLREMGYLTDLNLALYDVEEEQKEVLLSFHSEKLAIAYGLLNTPCGFPIRVMKNLRVCRDCHVSVKYISWATNREIMLRDMRRFHHFKDGQCSCGDYW